MTEFVVVLTEPMERGVGEYLRANESMKHGIERMIRHFIFNKVVAKKDEELKIKANKELEEKAQSDPTSLEAAFYQIKPMKFFSDEELKERNEARTKYLKELYLETFGAFEKDGE